MKNIKVSRLGFSTLFVVCVALLAFYAFRPRPITIFMVGDSTMANKPITGSNEDNQERGWGQMLQQYFDSDYVLIDNHARNGRSSKSFIDEGRWETVKNKIVPGDYVVIQFGHNDEKNDESRHTDPGTTFDANLKLFIAETRERGGIPILMNSIVRRKFYSDSTSVADSKRLLGVGDADKYIHSRLPMETDTLVDTHKDYIVAPRKVAAETGCMFVEANIVTHDYIQSLGPVKSKELFCWLPKGKYKTAPDGRQDDTHLNIKGGNVIAGLLAKEMVKQDATLKKYFNKKALKKYKIK